MLVCHLLALVLVSSEQQVVAKAAAWPGKLFIIRKTKDPFRKISLTIVV